MKKFIILTLVMFFIGTSLVFAAQKTITSYMRAGDVIYPIELNVVDFVTNGTPDAITGSLANNNLSLGNNRTDSSGSYWYSGDSDVAYCVDGKCNFGVGLRVYYEFIFRSVDTSNDSTSRADGYTFSIANGAYNNKNSTGGPPATISMGELLGYAGPGRTDGLGLRPPKLAIEFDTFRNADGDVCSSASRNDANNNNHIALMLWGDNLTGNCSISGTNYPKASFDDNRHGSGSGDNPINSQRGDGTGGYYEVAKGTSTYNWLEDNQWHNFRMEVTRSMTPSGGKYAYNVKAWVDCPSCSAVQLNAFKNLALAYDGLPPQINRTVMLTAADHAAFNTMLFGWTEGTGGSVQTIGIQNFNVYFPRSVCSYGINPISASYNNSAQTGRTVSLLTVSGCSWTAVSNHAWITVTSGASGNGNGTVTYNVAGNAGTARTGTITIGDQLFTVYQEAVPVYTITANSGANGTISPSGAVSVNGGTNQTFTITPNANYHVADVLVDGVSVGAVTSYTFTNVTANHAIAATFAINPCTLTITDNSFACKLAGNSRVYIKVYVTNGWGSPVTDAAVTYSVSGGGGSGNLTNLGGGYYGGTQTSNCGLGNNCVRTASISSPRTVTITATRSGCAGSPLIKTMTVP